MKIIILSFAQFGYHTDFYQYSKYLSEYYSVQYISGDFNYKKINYPEVDVIYIKKTSSYFTYLFKYLYKAIICIKKEDSPVVLINYFKGCSILRFFIKKGHFIFDVRSSYISKNKIKRSLINKLISFEAIFFRNITVITESLGSYLNLPDHKCHILPLGADIISNTNKEFKELNLIYIGTFHNRNIEQTIKGLKMFVDKFAGKVKVKYTIIGFGLSNDSYIIEKTISELELKDIVCFKGRIPNTELKEYLDEHNIGVCYIPTFDYFQIQPPTKLFEYLQSGLSVIATDTIENKKIINESNGVIINDNSVGFYEGLVYIYKNLNNYDSGNVRDGVSSYSWSHIIKYNLMPYIKHVINQVL